MNITKRTKSEETTVYQFRVFLSQSADGKQRTRSKTWQPPAGMTAKAAEKEAKRQAVIFENEVKQGRAALDARTKLSDVAREYIRNTEMEYKTKRVVRVYAARCGGRYRQYADFGTESLSNRAYLCRHAGTGRQADVLCDGNGA